MLAHCAGDSASFGELFARYAPILERALRRFGPSKDQLADLVQQTFLQLHRARNDFRHDSELRPWLMTIAFNLAREQFRRARRRPETELDATAEFKLAHQPVEQQLFERRRDLSLALAQLPSNQQEVVRLHFWLKTFFKKISEPTTDVPCFCLVHVSFICSHRNISNDKLLVKPICSTPLQLHSARRSSAQRPKALCPKNR